MKILIGTLLLMGQILMLFFVLKASKEKHRLAKTVRKLLCMGFAILFVNTVILFTNHEVVSLVGYSLYFVAADWMLYYLFRFSVEYIGEAFSKYVKVNAMRLLLCADCISLIFNGFFRHQFSIKSTEFLGETYYMIEITPFFFIHYAIIAMIAVFCFISLIYRSYHAPVFYRKKYLMVAILLMVLASFNAFCIFFPFDFSVLGFVVEGACIYYCAFVYTPQQLLSTTLFKVSRDMSVGIFVLDAEGSDLYSNSFAEELFDKERPLVDAEGKTLHEWCKNSYLNQKNEFTVNRHFFRDEDEFILKIQLQRMIDDRKLLQGGYFVMQDCTEEYNKQKKERYLATHDPLTGIYNKSYFCEKVKKYIERFPDEELVLICSDIKDFKMVNDFFGTTVGDCVLISFADMLKNRISGALISGRIGNDIFGVLMNKDSFDEKLFLDESQTAFSYCMNKTVVFPMMNYLGVYEITDRSLPVTVMCDRARLAIGSIKGDYHKRVAYYDEALRENIRHEQELITELGAAICEEQLKMYLQPQMSCDGRLLGAEALIRWHHPEKGQILPNEFIPVFEKNGLISEVDKYIWELACKQLKKWKDAGINDVYISVNISPRDFYFLNIYQIFTDMVNKYDIDPSSIKLEITETAIVMDFKRQLELISRLRQNGFVVEMDDFGSGYSSLNMLKDIHVDVLKIDMAFLRKAEDEERSKKILQMIIGLSKQLEMPVITEGVETEEQVRFLTEMGCDMFQGYYFAKPMSVSDFEKLYHDQKAGCKVTTE